MYGQIEYDAEGKPMCEICGKHYHRVMSHARQVHNINEKEYKAFFGIDHIKGICSKESSERTRVQTLKWGALVIDKNLKKSGAKTRFEKGAKGRTKDMVSEQTRKRLTVHLNKVSATNKLKTK